MIGRVKLSPSALLGGSSRLLSSVSSPALLRSDRQHLLPRLREIHGADSAAILLSSDDPSSLSSKYTRCWLNKYGIPPIVFSPLSSAEQHPPSLVVLPKTLTALRQTLSLLNETSTPVVPQGGNTGLVGGSVPLNHQTNEVVLSLSRLKPEDGTPAISVSDDSQTVTALASCALQSVQEYCDKRGYVFPLDIGSKGSCQIGGVVATNAGGHYFRRFGSISDNLVGLDVVLANGELLNLRPPSDGIFKDNMGYPSLRHLFVGSEGTLGVVTSATFRLHKKPSSRTVFFFSCPSFASVMRVLSASRRELGQNLSAVELMDGPTLSLVAGRSPPGRLEAILGSSPASDGVPLSGVPYYVLVESLGYNASADLSQSEAFASSLFASADVTSGVLATDTKRCEALWSVRDGAGPAVNACARKFKYDLSLSPLLWPALLEAVNGRIGKEFGAKAVSWGHLGDGNVHLNVVVEKVEPDDSRHKDGSQKLKDVLDDMVFEYVIKNKGSISAEHGVGSSKTKYVKRMKGESVYKVMKGVKTLFDPKNILSPNTIFFGSDEG